MLHIATLLLLEITGNPLAQSTGCADCHPGLPGVSRLPDESHPYSISGFAAVGALANKPGANDCEQVYVPGPMRHSSESDPLKANPVITLDQLPVLNSAARSAHVVPSAAPAAVVEKYRVTIATAYDACSGRTQGFSKVAAASA